MQTYNLSSLTHSEYGTRGGSWGNTTDQSVSDNDRNRFYLGHGQWVSSGSMDTWRSRLYFTIPSNLIIAGTAKLVITLIADSGWTPKRMRAYLSTKNTPNSNTSHIVGTESTAADRLAMSYLYADADGNIRQTAYMAATDNKTQACYLIFNYAFKPGTTYYIYFLPYDSDSATVDGWVFENTWCRWRNLSSYTAVVLYYESGTAWVFNGSSWQRAIPWVFDGSTWRQAVPWVFDGSTWRQGGG